MSPIQYPNPNPMPKAKKSVRAKKAQLSTYDLVKHFKLSRTRVRDLIAEGCPRTSFKAADAWRKQRTPKRVPTQAGLNENGRDEKLKGKPEIPPDPSKTGDSLLDALTNAIIVSDCAFADFQSARVNKLASRSARLSEHNKALEARLKTEKAYREEMERRKLLIPIIEATDMCRRAIESVLRRLKKLPDEQGPQCNPQNPLLARQILQAEVNTIMAVGKKVLDVLKT